MKSNETINNLKLRLGWGVVGNQSVPDYAYTSVYGTSATNWGSGQIATNTANPNLGWEKTTQKRSFRRYKFGSFYFFLFSTISLFCRESLLRGYQLRRPSSRVQA